MSFARLLFLMCLPLVLVPAGAQTGGRAAREIVIGQSAALSGPAQALGKDMQSGALLAFDQVNAAGGIDGRAIRLITRDDGYEPGRTATNTRALINEDKVLALFGFVGTPTSLAALPLFTEAQVPFIGAHTGAGGLRTPFNRYIFNVRAGYDDEIEKLVQHLSTLGQTRIAVFYQNDSFGRGGLEGVERAMKRRQLAVIATGTVERNTVDVAGAVARIHEARPEAVIMISAYTSISAFVKAMLAKGCTCQFLNVSFVGSKALADALGDAGSGVIVSQVVPFPWSGTLPVVRDYQLQVKRMGRGPESYSFTELEGYIAARVLIEGLRRMGKGEPSRASLIAGLESLGETRVGGFEINYSAVNHNASSFVDLSILGRNGRFLH